MLDGHVRGRKYRREVFGHVGVLGGAFEVAEHLDRELTGRVDPAAFRPDFEALGGSVVEVAAPVVLAVGANPHGSFCTRGSKSVPERVTRSQYHIKNAGKRAVAARLGVNARRRGRNLAHGFGDSVCKIRIG